MTKSVLITGANGGIGQALCTLFKEAGYYVVATGRTKIAACDCDHYIQADLFELVNNAAVQILSSLNGLKLDDFKKNFSC